jgi:hypothetical protein
VALNSTLTPVAEPFAPYYTPDEQQQQQQSNAAPVVENDFFLRKVYDFRCVVDVLHVCSIVVCVVVAQAASSMRPWLTSRFVMDLFACQTCDLACACTPALLLHQSIRYHVLLKATALAMLAASHMVIFPRSIADIRVLTLSSPLICIMISTNATAGRTH